MTATPVATIAHNGGGVRGGVTTNSGPVCVPAVTDGSFGPAAVPKSSSIKNSSRTGLPPRQTNSPRSPLLGSSTKAICHEAVEEVLLNEHIHLRQKDSEAGMGMVPAQNALFGKAGFHLLVNVGPGFGSERDLRVSRGRIISADVGGDESPGAGGVAINAADDHAAYFNFGVAQGVFADVIEDGAADENLIRILSCPPRAVGSSTWESLRIDAVGIALADRSAFALRRTEYGCRLLPFEPLTIGQRAENGGGIAA